MFIVFFFFVFKVGRKIDYIIPRIGEHLPLDPTINILNPIIETGAFPTNLCAIKIMTELAEKQGTQISDTHLDSIMSKIIPVRKKLNEFILYFIN